MAVKGSFLDSLGKLFASPQQKEREKLDRQRRIQYLKRKYVGMPSHVHAKRSKDSDE